MQETWVPSLGWEGPLEKEMATHSVFLPGKSHGHKSLVGYSPWGHKRVGHDLATKQQLTNNVVLFSGVQRGWKSWTIKKAEGRRTDPFELWCWRRLLRVPWTARRSNQSILKEISPEYSLEGLKLKLQYFGHLMRITDSFEKTLMLGKIEGRRRRG